MKLERAQEIYSDYEEGALSPAMQLALEQHFGSDAESKQDYDEFSRIVGLISESMTEEVEVPHGFRAKVLERVAREGQRQPAATSGGLAASLRSIFTIPKRPEAAVALSLALVVAIALIFKPLSTATNPTTISGGVIGIATPGGAPPDVAPSVIKGLDTQIVNNTVYHDLSVHLPDSIPSAVVNAYAISSTDQILDPAVRQRDAIPVLQNQELTNDEGMTIPMEMVRSAPAGSTLIILVDWTTPGSNVPSGTQVVFTPFNPDEVESPSTAPPSNGNFFDSLQTIASAYHVTVVADATYAPTGSVAAWSPGQEVDSALNAVARSAGYAVRKIEQKTPENGEPATYLVYRPTPH